MRLSRILGALMLGVHACYAISVAAPNPADCDERCQDTRYIKRCPSKNGQLKGFRAEYSEKSYVYCEGDGTTNCLAPIGQRTCGPTHRFIMWSFTTTCSHCPCVINQNMANEKWYVSAEAWDLDDLDPPSEVLHKVCKLVATVEEMDITP